MQNQIFQINDFMKDLSPINKSNTNLIHKKKLKKKNKN